MLQWLGSIPARSSIALLRRSIIAMPKVPVTSKRARTVMSSEPLIPDSMKPTQSSRKEQPRRSSRVRSLSKTETAAPLIDLPSKSKQTNAQRQQDDGQSQTGSKRGSSASKKRGPKAVAAVAIEEKSVKPTAKKEPESKSKRRRTAKSVKQESEDVLEAAALEIKSEGNTLPVTDNDIEGHGVVKVEDVEKVARKKGSKSRSKKAADAKGAVDGAEVVVKVEKEGRKKKRRGPTGYALIGEGVEDTPADRRARLKAARLTGPTEIDAVPSVLESEVALMCSELGNESLGQTAPWQKSEGEVGGLKWWTGCHVSTSGGIEKAVINAAAIGCRAFSMDTRCKMRWESKAITDETAAAFRQACATFGFGPEQILPHGSYLINLASPDPDMAEKGYGGFLDELQRCEKLGLTRYNFHPGSTTGLCTHEESMDRIAGFINRAHKATKGVTVVLENMSSVGNIVGGRPWHLKYIIDRVEDKTRIGYCIDTCHLFSSGKDLRTVEACEATFQEIDEVVGLEYLRGMHVNDSKTPFDSHRDRHENIGRGSIPMEAFRWIMNNPKFQGVPLIMETPVQEREPPVDYKLSLQHGRVQWKDPGGPYGVGTDRRDVMLLNSLVATSGKKD